MNKPLLALSVAVSMALFGATLVHAADLRPYNADSPGEGYNDATPAAPVGGNPGITLGEQRQLVALFAADLWGSVLVSDVPVYIQAQFNPLGANVLGSAGTYYIFSDFPNATRANTFYSSALSDALSGVDQTVEAGLPEGFPDIVSQFSSDFSFYYGLDDNTPIGQYNFLDVIMHEIGHGLGFANFESEASGAFSGGLPDIYSTFTYDNTQGKFWPDMTAQERRASAINYGNVVFTGANAVMGAALTLDVRNRPDFHVTAPGSIAGTYQYGDAEFGPAVTATNLTGNVVLGSDGLGAVNDGCEPLVNGAAIAGNIALLDRGTCAFTIKALNAQNAGATGVLIANNEPANPPPGMSGVDPAIVIPSVRITQGLGTAMKSILPGVVSVGFTPANPNGLQGADDAGRPRLFMPDPVQGGSSGSHYDTALSPNALMEPAINDSLHAALNLDITPNLLKDTGWKLNPGNAVIDGCDTGIRIVDDAGIIIGANVQATSNLCLYTATARGDYQNCMSGYKDRLLAANLITDKQAGKMMSCAAHLGKDAKGK